MPVQKLPPFQNVGANLAAVLPAIPQGMTTESITLKLGGTAFTKDMLSGIRLWLGGKKIWEITGSHIDSINQYFRLTASAAYLTLWFANPRAKSLADYLIGAIDTSAGYSNFSMEVDIGAATAPTLEARARLSAPIGKDRPYKGLIRTLVKSTHTPTAGTESSLAIPLGGRQGALIRALHLFPTTLVVSKVQVFKDSFPLIHEGDTAPLKFMQNEISRTTQAGLNNADFVLEDYDALSVPTLRPDGNPASFDVKVTTDVAGSITGYSDLLQTLDAV